MDKPIDDFNEEFLALIYRGMDTMRRIKMESFTTHAGDPSLLQEAAANGQLVSTSSSTGKDARDKLRAERVAAAYKLDYRVHIGNMVVMYLIAPEMLREHVRRLLECM